MAKNFTLGRLKNGTLILLFRSINFDIDPLLLLIVIQCLFYGSLFCCTPALELWTISEVSNSAKHK